MAKTLKTRVLEAQSWSGEECVKREQEIRAVISQAETHYNINLSHVRKMITEKIYDYLKGLESPRYHSSNVI